MKTVKIEIEIPECIWELARLSQEHSLKETGRAPALISEFLSASCVATIMETAADYEILRSSDGEEVLEWLDTLREITLED